MNNNSVYIIAEIGVNHNGNLELAKKSIDAAKSTGANAVKFQTFKTEKLTTRTAETAKYQKNNTGKIESQFDMLKKLELTADDFFELKTYCEMQEIDFLSTPFDEESASLLKEIGVHAYKIGSGDLTNIPLLKKIDMFGVPVLLSTGMSNMEEVKEALNCFQTSPVTVLHCTSNYPAASEDINLLAMKSIEKEFQVPIGYSDHSLGYDVSICAVSMGAKVIEKHFTLDKNLPGPDHKASLDPSEFTKFVNKIRNCEVFLGDGIKRSMPSEESTRDVARKSVVASMDLKKGTILSANMLTVKRPGYGIKPSNLYKIIGKRITVDKKVDSVILEGEIDE